MLGELKSLLKDSIESENTVEGLQEILLSVINEIGAQEKISVEFCTPLGRRINQMDEEELADILDYLDEEYGLGLFEEEGLEIEVPDYLMGQEYDESDEESMSEEILTQKTRRMRALKAKKKKRLGKKAQSLNFKRNYYFDKEKRKFVRRDQALKVTTLRKKTKVFKRVTRKSATKARIKRSKKRFANAPKINV